MADVRNHLGGGLTGRYEGLSLAIGHFDFVAGHTTAAAPERGHGEGMEIWLVSDREWLARFQLDDQVREDAADAIAALKRLGIRTLLLSGDRSRHVTRVAAALGIEEAIGQASPEQKLAVLEQLRGDGHQVMMVGDGLNDLPSMAGAGLSVAMGSAADLTQLQADAVLLNGQLMQLVEALETGRRTGG